MKQQNYAENESYVFGSSIPFSPFCHSMLTSNFHSNVYRSSGNARCSEFRADARNTTSKEKSAKYKSIDASNDPGSM